MDSMKLVRSSKIIDRILKILQGFMTAGIIVCVIFVPLVLLFGEKMVAGGDNVTCGSLALQLADTSSLNVSGLRALLVPILLLSAVMCGIVWYVLRVLRGIIAPMKDGRPFEQGISGQIRKMAWISLIGGAVYEIGKAVTVVLYVQLFDLTAIFNPDVVTGITFKYEIDGSFIIMAAVLFLLSYVFRCGEALQKESDETL